MLLPSSALLDAASCDVQGEPAERAVSVPLLYLQHPTAAVSNAAHSLTSAILQQTPQVVQLPFFCQSSTSSISGLGSAVASCHAVSLCEHGLWQLRCKA